jgi:hypothetical protein
VISAILSVLLGLLSWLGAPIVVPVIALALGANALVKARRGVERRQLQTVLGGLGALLGGLATLAILLGTYGG